MLPYACSYSNCFFMRNFTLTSLASPAHTPQIKGAIKYSANSSPNLLLTIRLLAAGCEAVIGSTWSVKPRSSIRLRVLAPGGPVGRIVLGPCSKITSLVGLKDFIQPPTRFEASTSVTGCLGSVFERSYSIQKAIATRNEH
ncbi:hypothetical protein NQ315_012658 [Exocentrus adspersus]|uniref:Uncharacterized protein n=1 Tax=Exocentrus adspersus TaxID=1586481 RepID=A0AAV8VTC3_9CUCU|nr:hypothetical protein NQ315_012658 [Exocentrus adspersus]